MNGTLRVRELLPGRTLLAVALVCILGFVGLGAAWAAGERIKDLATIGGVRDNQLVGYGLVVGLDGSGDQTTQTPFTVQSVVNMLRSLGVNLPPGNMQLKNVAAVMVTAELPPFARAGQRIDVTVSSLGNAKSLKGGTLVMTPLKGADGQIYAIAQGNVVVGGAGARSGGAAQQINHLSAGRIPAGATVEREVGNNFAQSEIIQLELEEMDFGTAAKIVRAIETAFGFGTAQALDGRTIAVRSPPDPNARIAFLARLQNLTVEPDVQRAKVVVNSRTGSVVMNQAVTLQHVAVAHGSLKVTIGQDLAVSQPDTPFAGGAAVAAQQGRVEIEQPVAVIQDVKGGANLADVVKALNALGATPMDLISILQALKSSGALRADLEVI
ncbi:flagellar basal body P-ring protein FlgI [Tepidiphilus baoligensis]|uniref:Flagellar P-ring protein n=1 Tax=Tepidiphilus baoligensis TaxID=2698687 RepID=A0ABX1QLX5_9PROT|nr:flagellar basal body P-ring protein FlgI [Tepidiphilus baoligensis]NMH16634.1 flagellar basal body P-ring protein FlgI [Tepidiphilus baoligensis]